MAKQRNKSHKPQIALSTKGRHHDLIEIYNAMNWQHFNGKILVRITWGRKLRIPKRKHQSLRFGVCYVEECLISIHRALDRSWVPRFFVEYVVFHEMLHLKHPPRRKNGRDNLHHEKFVAAEKKFPDYDMAMCWEKDNLNRLFFF